MSALSLFHVCADARRPSTIVAPYEKTNLFPLCLPAPRAAHRSYSDGAAWGVVVKPYSFQSNINNLKSKIAMVSACQRLYADACFDEGLADVLGVLGRVRMVAMNAKGVDAQALARNVHAVAGEGDCLGGDFFGGGH